MTARLVQPASRAYEVPDALETAERRLDGPLSRDVAAKPQRCEQFHAVPAQWAVQTALGGFQSIQELVRPGGRLYQSRQTVIDRVNDSRWLSLVKPMGAMYAFVRLAPAVSSKLDDRRFALELLETKHVLVAPGSSFNTPYSDHFRITTLPDPDTLNVVFDRIDELLAHHAS